MSRYKIRIEKNVLRSLKKLPRNLKNMVESVLKDVVENPFKFKPLRYELKGLFSARVGNFRLIYAIEGDTIIIYAFEHRKKAYR